MRAGLDIGGTTTAAVLVADDGRVVARAALPSGHGPAAVLDVAVAVVAELHRAAGLGPGAVTALGVGVPGTVDSVRGRLRHAVNLGVEDLDLAAALGARLGVPVHVENDVNAAALGAYRLLTATGRRPASMAYLNLGTGLACGLVLDGRLWRGSSGAAGEIGHVPLDPRGEPCTCGQRGCLETLCSGSAVARRWPTAEGPPPAALLAAAAAGDPAAGAVWQDVLAGVGAAVRLVALSWDVEVVALGGGMSNLGASLLTGVCHVLAASAAASPFLASLDLPARVRLTPHPQDAATCGAAALAERRPAPARN